MTGGRRLDSDLYRVYYDGDANTEAAVALEQTEENKIRQELETYHLGPKEGAVEAAWPHLNSEDRFLQYAARLALEHQPLAQWQNKVFSETDAARKIQGAIALARQGGKNLQPQLLDALTSIDYAGLNTAQQVDLVRGIELTLSRMGKPSAGWQKKVRSYLPRITPLKLMF